MSNLFVLIHRRYQLTRHQKKYGPKGLTEKSRKRISKYFNYFVYFDSELTFVD